MTGTSYADRPIPPAEWDVHIHEDAKGRRVFRSRWGLTPPWDYDGTTASKIINVRAETLMEKAFFRALLPRNRSITPISGFSERDQNASQGRRRVYIEARDGQPLALAGLWTAQRNPQTGRAEYSHTIITTEANGTMAPFHHRMPVILDRDGVETWLNSDITDPAAVLGLLRPAPDDWLVAHPVSTRVNAPQNDRTQLTLRLGDASL